MEGNLESENSSKVPEFCMEVCPFDLTYLGYISRADIEFEVWLFDIFNSADEYIKLSSATLLWSIWKNRNDVVWNAKTWEMEGVRMLAINIMHDMIGKCYKIFIFNLQCLLMNQTILSQVLLYPTKQTLVATSSNHAELIAIHEASRECVWLRSITRYIIGACGLPVDNTATTIYEDNAACIAQLKEGYIKGDRIKHISPKFFFTHDLQKKNEINIQQIRSCDNLADLFTKALPTTTFKKLVRGIDYGGNYWEDTERERKKAVGVLVNVTGKAGCTLPLVPTARSTVWIPQRIAALTRDLLDYGGNYGRHRGRERMKAVELLVTNRKAAAHCLSSTAFDSLDTRARR
nr:Copia protein [Ipomoea batatas]